MAAAAETILSGSCHVADFEASESASLEIIATLLFTFPLVCESVLYQPPLFCLSACPRLLPKHLALQIDLLREARTAQYHISSPLTSTTTSTTLSIPHPAPPPSTPPLSTTSSSTPGTPCSAARSTSQRRAVARWGVSLTHLQVIPRDPLEEGTFVCLTQRRARPIQVYRSRVRSRIDRV